MSCRFHDSFGKKTTPKVKIGDHKSTIRIDSLTGEKIGHWNPFQIGQVVMTHKNS